MSAPGTCRLADGMDIPEHICRDSSNESAARGQVLMKMVQTAPETWLQ